MATQKRKKPADKRRKLAFERYTEGNTLAERNPGKLMEEELSKKEELALMQRLRQEKGSHFEADFKNSAKFFNCFATKLITGYDGTPFDYYFTTPLGAFALELKCCIKHNLHYSRIRSNQKWGLEAFEKETKGFGKSYFLVNVSCILFEHVYAIPWVDVREGILGKASGSFNVTDWPQLEHLRLDLKKPDGSDDTQFIWDLSMFCGEVKEEYKDAYIDAKDRNADIRRGGFGLTKKEAIEVKRAIDYLESRLREEAAIKAAALGVPPPDFTISDLIPKPTRVNRYPTTRAPSNGAIRNKDTWGEGKGIGLHGKNSGSKKTTSGNKL